MTWSVVEVQPVLYIWLLLTNANIDLSVYLLQEHVWVDRVPPHENFTPATMIRPGASTRAQSSPAGNMALAVTAITSQMARRVITRHVKKRMSFLRRVKLASKPPSLLQINLSSLSRSVPSSFSANYRTPRARERSSSSKIWCGPRFEGMLGGLQLWEK